MTKQAQQGFTLAELLISLAILGVIATFTIPTLIGVSTAAKEKSIAKEAASMVAGAASSYLLNSSVSASTKGADFIQFMNYVTVDTTTNYSAGANQTGTALQQCSATLPCLKLHNGGILQYDTAMTMGGTSSTNAVYFNFDPDGTGTAGRITFVQFSNSRMSTGELAGTATPTGGTLTREATDPNYLKDWS